MFFLLWAAGNVQEAVSQFNYPRSLTPPSPSHRTAPAEHEETANPLTDPKMLAFIERHADAWAARYPFNPTIFSNRPKNFQYLHTEHTSRQEDGTFIACLFFKCIMPGSTGPYGIMFRAAHSLANTSLDIPPPLYITNYKPINLRLFYDILPFMKVAALNLGNWGSWLIFIQTFAIEKDGKAHQKWTLFNRNASVVKFVTIGANEETFNIDE